MTIWGSVKLAGLAFAFVAMTGCQSGETEAQTEPDVEAAAEATAEAPAPVYDEIRPEITQWMRQPAILVFSKTMGWRHNEGIAGADKYFVELSRERGYGIFTTVNSAVFNAEDLARFEVVVFNNVTGDALSPQQELAFQDWLESGGAWIGIHGSGDHTHADWPWYAEGLIGPTFIGHPQTPHFNEVRIETLAKDHPIMAGIPDVWSHNDEWYFFDSRPQDYGLLPLAGILEEDFAPEGDDVAKLETWAMGDRAIDHPVVWVGCPEAGRSFYTALGHSDLSYDDPVNRQMLSNAFDWVTVKTYEAGAGCP